MTTLKDFVKIKCSSKLAFWSVMVGTIITRLTLTVQCILGYCKNVLETINFTTVGSTAVA